MYVILKRFTSSFKHYCNYCR